MARCRQLAASSEVAGVVKVGIYPNIAMARLLTPLLIFAACYAWMYFAKASAGQRNQLLKLFGWGAGLVVLMLFAIRSGQLTLAAVVALVLVGLRALPELAARPNVGAGKATGANVGDGAAASRRGNTPMSRSEALRVLDLDEAAGAEEINARYRSLVKMVHPDLGGSSYLTAQLNTAREVLLGGASAKRGV
jgi:hypothetical protein